MGLKLDWEIEAEQSTVKREKEDRSSARARRMARLRILLGILLIGGVLGGIYGVFVWRLRVVDAEIQRALEDTVRAEVTTLRVADRNAFLSIQRSATLDWQNEQTATFNQYQQLKSENSVQLTGDILSSDVQGSRARVQVQEIIDGVPYVQTWFYWRYADAEGWRHVPPDYAFWGSEEAIESERVRVTYFSLDQRVAEAVSVSVTDWIDTTCAALGCAELPQITIDIVPEPGLTARWNETGPWRLELPSPYVGRARLDRPFSDETRARVATLVAERLLVHITGSVQPTFPADAVFLQGAVEDWLVGRFTSLDRGSHLIRSYAERYGENAVGEALRNTAPGSDIRVLLAPAGVDALNQLEVDWRDYLSWRLELENELHRQRDEANFVSLYDTRLDEVAGLSFQRFAAANAYEDQTVVAVQPETQPDGVPGLRATVQVGEGDAARQQEVLFRLSDGVWKRAN